MPVIVVKKKSQVHFREAVNLDRRTCARTLAGLSVSSSLLEGSAAAAQGSEPRLRLGIRGAPYSQASAKLKMLRDLPDVVLTGVFDHDSKVRDSVARQGIPVLSQEEVLAQGDRGVFV
jgi:signal transduction protein with GAF and PtsI domain